MLLQFICIRLPQKSTQIFTERDVIVVFHYDDAGTEKYALTTLCVVDAMLTL